MNQNLANALETAGVTPQQLAGILQVDPKSVTRWLNGPTTPYPRHRARIARALNVTEAELWPEPHKQDPARMPDGSAEAPDENRLDHAHHAPIDVLGDLAASWGHTDDPDAPDPAALIESTDGPVDLLAGGYGIPLTGRLLAALAAADRNGRHVRIIASATVNIPASLSGLEHTKVRLLPLSVRDTLLRCGDLMLVTFSLAHSREPPGLIKLKQARDGGLFDRLTRDFHAIWQHLDTQSSTRTDAKPTAAAGQDPQRSGADTGSQPAGVEPPRHWPRHPR